MAQVKHTMVLLMRPRKSGLAIPRIFLPLKYFLLFFPYNTFHMFISTDNIVYFSTWYEFPA